MAVLADGSGQVDWRNLVEQASVAARLIKSVKHMEKERRRRDEGEVLWEAPAWGGQPPHFRLREKLEEDGPIPRIFGAVFEHMSDPPPPGAPRLLLAFRGTRLSKSDIKLDFSIVWNKLHQTARFQKALDAVRSAVDEVGHEHVWVAGHSLGAAIVLQAGKRMAEGGVFLKAFLFSPPFVSLPLEAMVLPDAVKEGIRFVHEAVTATLAVAVGRAGEAPLEVWSRWNPDMFLNPGDHLSSGYIGWFKRRERFKSEGGLRGWIERVGGQHSLRSLVLGAFNREKGKITHLIPSARVTVHHGATESFSEAHGVAQWFNPDIHRLDTQTYTFPYSK